MSKSTIQADAAKPKALPFVEMVRLMRVEADKAYRHGYPLSCLLAGLDDLDSIEDAREVARLQGAVFKALKKVTYTRNVQGMGAFNELYLAAIFPHFDVDAVKGLAEELVERAAEAGIGLSVGVAHNRHRGKADFGALIEDAETGLGLARSAGGGVQQWRAVEDELEELRSELDEEIAAAHAQSEVLAQSDDEVDAWGSGLLERIVAAFDEEVSSPETIRIQGRIVKLVREEVTGWKESALGRQLTARTRNAANLERRVRKLSELLEMTEGELKRVAAAKSIDTGISSIYRDVQGLDADEDQAELKRELMKDIFQANLVLRGKEAPAATTTG